MGVAGDRIDNLGDGLEGMFGGCFDDIGISLAPVDHVVDAIGAGVEAEGAGHGVGYAFGFGRLFVASVFDVFGVSNTFMHWCVGGFLD